MNLQEQENVDNKDLLVTLDSKGGKVLEEMMQISQD